MKKDGDYRIFMTDGVRLGRACFKIIERLGISHKVCHASILAHISLLVQVSWITCDNASNNNTMMEEFARRLNKLPSHQHKKKWHHRMRRIWYGSPLHPPSAVYDLFTSSWLTDVSPISLIL